MSVTVLYIDGTTEVGVGENLDGESVIFHKPGAMHELRLQLEAALEDNRALTVDVAPCEVLT